MSRRPYEVLTVATMTLVAVVALCVLAGPAAASSCDGGCSAASKTCRLAAKISKTGCYEDCKETWNASDHGEAAAMALDMCIENCKLQVATDETNCLNGETGCGSQCTSATDPDCADACGTTYQACAQTAKNALTSCRNGCSDGACKQNCATQAQSDLAACKGTPGFDYCLSLGPLCAAASTCGNSVLEPGEECDGGANCSVTCIDLDDDDDGIPEDGDNSGTVGDAPCPDGVTTGCDDNCPEDANSDQADFDGDLVGNVCEYNCFGVTGAQVDGGVYANSVAPANGIANAIVEACNLDLSCCSTTVADGNGLYQFTNLNPGTYVLIGNSTGEELSDGITLLVAGGPYTGQDIVLTGPQPPAASTSLGGQSGPNIPSVRPGQTVTLDTDGCLNGIATYTITQNGLTVYGPASLPEVPAGSGQYSTVIPAGSFAPGDPNELTIQIDCPNPDPDETETFTVYIDPSGFVRFVNGSGAVGATVTLLRSDTPTGPFTVVPDQSAIMSPTNRDNPDTTDATGHFGWDVVAGFYQVHADFGGCTVDSEIMKIPPPVTDLNLVLPCPCIGGPQPSCRTAGKSVLVMKDNANDAGDSFAWKWLKGASTTQGEFGSPLSSTTYDVCVYAATPSPLVALTIPPGATHWAQKGTTKYKYSDSATTSTGVKTVIVSWSDDDKTKVQVKGKGPNLPDPTLGALPAPLTVQLQQRDSNVCFESTFAAGDVTKNTTSQYKATAP